jgi:hypothetical protein
MRHFDIEPINDLALKYDNIFNQSIFLKGEHESKYRFNRFGSNGTKSGS